NFPVRASIVGKAFGGGTPFQAEIYFINLAGVIQLQFRLPYFDVQDPRFPDLPVPITVGGTMSFKIGDYREFIRLHRLINFSLDDFKAQIKATLQRRIKGLLTNVLYQLNCPLVQVERNIDSISDVLHERLVQDIAEFGVQLTRLDIDLIEPDKESEAWLKLQQVTGEYAVRSTAMNQDNALRTAQAQNDINIRNMDEMQTLNTENLRDTMRVNREESQYAQHLTSQEAHMGAYATTLQSDVLKTAASSLGSMGAVGGNGGFNPASMMTGMAVGGAMGQQMANMTNTLGQQFTNPTATMPPMPGQQPQMPQVEYMVSINSQASGPYNMLQLQQLVQMGQLTPQTYVWRQGLPNWVLAAQAAELAPLFTSGTPHGMPPVPGSVPGMPPVPPQQ
ncbi:MAG: GYF domain-containing protein, partial [Muribaculaceae bacterium]|nr:GYF domain-containing protein [Muribaculaceae bacterium]